MNINPMSMDVDFEDGFSNLSISSSTSPSKSSTSYLEPYLQKLEQGLRPENARDLWGERGNFITSTFIEMRIALPDSNPSIRERIAQVLLDVSSLHPFLQRTVLYYFAIKFNPQCKAFVMQSIKKISNPETIQGAIYTLFSIPDDEMLSVLESDKESFKKPRKFHIISKLILMLQDNENTRLSILNRGRTLALKIEDLKTRGHFLFRLGKETGK